MRMRRRAWTEPMLDGCPFFIEEPSKHIGRWPELFEKKQRVMLEIGCGKGVSTAQMAHENPDVNYIAVDEVRHVLAVSVKNIRAAYGEQPPGNILLSAVDALRIHDTPLGRAGQAPQAPPDPPQAADAVPGVFEARRRDLVQDRQRRAVHGLKALFRRVRL